MLDTVVLSGEDVCYSVMFCTLVGVFSVMWPELLMTSDINCILCSSVYECQRVACAFTSPVRTKCGMFVMCCPQCCMLCQLFCNAWMCCFEEVYRCFSQWARILAKQVWVSII